MKSLTSRLTLTAVTLVACVSILVAISATLVMRSYLVARLDDQINASMERTQNALDGADRFGRGLTNRNNDRNGMSTAPCRRSARRAAKGAVRFSRVRWKHRTSMSSRNSST